MSGAWLGELGELGELGALVGKCASCRFSAWSGEVRGAGLVCVRSQKPEIARPGWTCEAYEYEPGSVQ